MATEVFVGDPARFPDGKALASYVGMIPSEHSSSRRQRLGALSKQGNPFLRFLWCGARGTALSRPAEPNALWCADYKGEFMLGVHRYCYPLTITEFASRYLLTCEALSTTQEKFAFTIFERTFKEFGLPQATGPTTACRSHPPTPSTASANSPCGGSDSAWRSNGRNPGIPSRTAGTSACI